MTIQSINVRIGARVAELRVSKGISAIVAAQAADLSPEDYAAREDGRERFSAVELYCVAQVLDVPLEEVFRGLVSTSDEIARKRN